MDAIREFADEAPWKVAAGLALLHALLALAVFTSAAHSGGDNVAYLSLARSLLEHGRMLELWDPAQAVHTQYPPGWPAVLAAAWVVGIRGWLGWKLLAVAFSVAGVAGSYVLLRQQTEPVIALGLGILLAAAPGLLLDSGWVLTDVPFWAVSMVALVAFAKRRYTVAILLVLASLTLRTAALPLAVAALGWLLWRRQWRGAAGLAVGLGAWRAYEAVRVAGESAPYTSQFWMVNPYDPSAGTAGVVDLALRMLANGKRYVGTYLPELLVGSTGTVAALLGLLVVGFALVGFVHRVRTHTPERGERMSLIDLYAVLYAGMILLWPAQWAGTRFFLPLLPLVLLYAAEGLRRLPARLRPGLVAGLGLGVLLGWGAPATLEAVERSAACRAAVRFDGPTACWHPAHHAYAELARWSGDHLPDDAVVLARKPRQWYWFSGLPAARYPLWPDPDRLLATADSVGAGYIALDRFSSTANAYLLPAIAGAPQSYCLVHVVRQGGGEAALLRRLSAPWSADAVGMDGSEGLQLPYCEALGR